MSPDASAMQNVWPSTRVTWRGPPETDAAGNRFSHGDDSNVMLVVDEDGGDLAAGEAHDGCGSEPVHHVVPPVGEQHERPAGEVGMLGGQEPAHEALVDVYLRHRHVLPRHDA